MDLDDVKNLTQIKDYMDQLYNTLYSHRTGNSLPTSAMAFNNPFIRFTLQRYALQNNTCVCSIIYIS